MNYNEEKESNNVKLPCFTNWSLKKSLIWSSVILYLLGLIFGIIGWVICRQIDKTYEWNWEIIYGPIIIVVSYWGIAGMVLLYMWAKERDKSKKAK